MLQTQRMRADDFCHGRQSDMFPDLAQGLVETSKGRLPGTSTDTIYEIHPLTPRAQVLGIYLDARHLN